jgi:hypothetical protein
MVQLGTGLPELALQSLQLSGDLLVKLAEVRAAFKYELAQNHGWQAEAHELLGNYERALEEQKTKLKLFGEMPGGNKNKSAQVGVLGALTVIAKYELALGFISAAERTSQDAINLAQNLVADDPENLFWLAGACYARLNLVEAALARGNVKQAREEYAKASTCVGKYQLIGTRGVRDSTLLASRSLLFKASFVSGLERTALADEIEKLLGQATANLTSATPYGDKLAIDLARLSLTLGNLRAANSESSARSAWRNAEQLLRSYADRSDGAILTPLATARLNLGDVSGAKLLVDRIALSSYRHPAYADLVKKLQTVRAAANQ